MRTSLLIMAIALALTPWGAARSETASEGQVKAAFVFNFAKLLTWPDDRFEDGNSALRVCTLKGDSAGGWLLPALDGKQAGERRVEAGEVEMTQAADCHLVYLGYELEPRFEQLMPQLSGHGVVLVDEGARFTWPDGMIRLFEDAGRFRFEMNLATFESAGLRVDPRMIRLARIASR